MNKKITLPFLAFLAISLVGCNNNLVPQGDSGNKDGYQMLIKTNDGLSLLSESKRSIKDGELREAVPIFVDGHIDHFACPVYQYKTIEQVVNEGFIQFNISLKAKQAGSLYFNIDSDAKGAIQNALRIELYQQSTSKSVIYSYAGGESVTEGYLDLNFDGKNDRDGTFGDDGEEILYTTGSHSYNTEKFNTNSFKVMENDEELNLRATIFIDGFYTSNDTYQGNMKKINLLFDIK